MTRNSLALVALALLLPFQVLAQDVVVTRYFTGLWHQTQHENQGLNLQIVHQANGQTAGVAYWYTYGDDRKSAWYIGIGPVSGNRVEMTLYEVEDVGFLQDDDPSDDPVVDIGTLVMEFSSCNQGVVTYDTGLPGVGSGSFAVERITDLLNTQCSGGISDDTPPGVLATEQRITLVPARQGINASGHADFEERPDRTEFKVEAEDLANGAYRIFVGGVDRGDLVVSLGRGETEFRSPVEAGKVLLTFDPRGQVVEVHDGQGAVLTSGDVVFTGGDDNGGDDGNNGGDIDFGSTDIEVDLTNAGVYPAASGDAKLEPRADRTDFSVEIEDVPAGSYDLRIGGALVGTLQAALDIDGTVRGELEFRDPVEPGKILLDFDPRGQQIDVLEGNTVILGTLFPGG
ncbi:MAG: hypothetical protein ACSLE2_03070 [Lysobacterales bacterium]